MSHEMVYLCNLGSSRCPPSPTPEHDMSDMCARLLFVCAAVDVHTPLRAGPPTYLRARSPLSPLAFRPRRERAPSGHRCDACATRAPSDRRVPHAAYPALSRKRYLSLPPSPRARRNAVTEVGSCSLPSKREKAKRVEWAVGTSYILALPSIAPSTMALVTMWPDEG